MIFSKFTPRVLNSDGSFSEYQIYEYTGENEFTKRDTYIAEEKVGEIRLLFSVTANQRLILPLTLAYNCTVDWGDGSVEDYVYPNNVTHVYLSAGVKEVLVTGYCKGLDFGAKSTSCNSLIEVTNLEGEELTKVSFSRCNNLIRIVNKINCPKVTDFSYTFYYCTSLTTIPSDLFNNCTEVTDFRYAFYECASLTTIPSGLFSNSPNVTNFSYTFAFCASLTTIPSGLFSNSPNVTNFSYTFYYCTSLTTIPSGVFDGCPLVTNFEAAFYYCTSLTTMPSGVFDGCPLVTNFGWTFLNCTEITGDAPNLWVRQNVTLYQGCFYKCTKLTNYAEIPASWK